MGGICTVTSCGDQGSVMIRIEPTEDNVTSPDHIGYLLFALEGVLPRQISREAAEIRRGGELVYRDGFDDVLATNATVVLLAVDEAGNVSEPSEPFDLLFDGCTEVAGGGECRKEPLEQKCSVVQAGLGSHGQPWWLGFALALWVGRRKAASWESLRSGRIED